ncbi:MAG: hypothetical protein HC896_13245 [Bacteroidales bacterium]|nr:hypothetical protein [Bacteroidales bacterium]
MGEHINTAFDDNSAYVLPDNNTLIFASKGHFNMGGYDIFVSKKQDGLWQKPNNIGYPINTTADNKSFYPVVSDKEGYMSVISENGFGGEDIYRVSISQPRKSTGDVSPRARATENFSIGDNDRFIISHKLTEDTLGVFNINAPEKKATYTGYSNLYQIKKEQ